MVQCQEKIAECQNYAQYGENQDNTLAQELKWAKDTSAAHLHSAVEELGAFKTDYFALLGRKTAAFVNSIPEESVTEAKLSHSWWLFRS